MLKIITTLVLFAIGMAAKAQVTENRQTTEFSKIDVTNDIELVYTQDSTPLLMVEARSAEDLEKVVTKVKGRTLEISAKNVKTPVKVYVNSNCVASFTAKNKAKIVLTIPADAENMEVSLHSGAQFKGCTRSEKMKLYAGHQTVYNGRSESKTFTGSFTNATVNLSGTATYACLKANESSNVLARNFISDHSRVLAQSHASIVLYAKNNIRFDADESVTLKYFEPTQKVSSNTTLASK